MTTNTRLSLYKLFLGTTIWVALTPSEYEQSIAWLEHYKSANDSRNVVDNLYETFIWFPTTDEGQVWVPLGHLTRLIDQIDARVPTNAVNHPNLTLRERLRRHRETTNGQEILAVRLSTIFPQVPQ